MDLYENEYGNDTFVRQSVKNLNHISTNNFYHLSDASIKKLLDIPDPFNGDAYRVSVFNSAYSRITNQVPLNLRKPRKSQIRNGMEKIFSPMNISKTTRKETWFDVCVRVIEGLFSFYIDYLTKKILPIPENLDEMAEEALLTMATMMWLPPGRGLFAMGTNHTYRNGNAALNNCYAVSTKEAGLVKAAAWAMDMLMCGGGVGFSVDWRGDIIKANKSNTFIYRIPDTRQGWVCALELLLRAYIPPSDDSGSGSTNSTTFPIFDFSLIRGYGEPIKGFGGTASGPEPLRILLNRVEIFLDAHVEWKTGNSSSQTIFENMFISLHKTKSYQNVDYNFENTLKEIVDNSSDKQYNHTRLIMDIFNSIGACVVAGNVRRSAQIALGDPDDLSFLDMKDWIKCPERRPWMHLSNNTVRLWTSEDFETVLPLVSERIKNNGEPGIMNMINIQKYGRIGDETYGPDKATLLNPCAEISLESQEPCCLASIVPSNTLTTTCGGSSITTSKKEIDTHKLKIACKWATFYATVVTTIPHHWSDTNKVISRNRRIGISYAGIADVREAIGPTLLNKSYREAYKFIREFNTNLTRDLGIPKSVRVTTVKPEGTLSIIAGTSAGVHFPICRFGWRRVAFDNSSLVLKALLDAHYLFEKSTLSDNQTYVIFPIKSNSSKTTREASIFEKMTMVVAAQKHYADNSVSFTGDFKPSTEGDLIEELLADYIAQTKVISMLPQFEGSTDQYKHLPFQEISEEKYLDTLSKISPVNWSIAFDESGNMPDADKSATAYCTGDTCTINK